LALKQYLGDHPGIRKIVLRLDNDRTGRMAAKALTKMLSEEYAVVACFPPSGKDYNDHLCHLKGISKYQVQERSDTR